MVSISSSRLMKMACVLSVILLNTSLVQAKTSENKRSEFIDVGELLPNAVLDIRYFGRHNFVGAPIDGYTAPKCLLHKTAANALKNVQKAAQKEGLNLKIFDCYRPQRAVDHFVRWVNDLSDTRTKAEFYPNLNKDQLLGDYIAAKSGHSRGSTIDLTLVDAYGVELDMASPFDMFDTLSNTDDPRISATQKANRYKLKTLMSDAGFAPYSMEWWHFTYQPQAYPATYFNFVIK
ncbi:M15 family metallopeptidase [Pseudoalteromonas sp. 68 DY56-GL68]|uniref:M15 family metallopeptidase n=1 Tax=Pseudoalteromonas sp. 68 DY56-GL68 TaxID=2974919 RepID=UPI00352A6364